jgi:hypothetical protein
MTELTQEYLKSILHYDPETGIFTRLVKRNRRFLVGSIAGSPSSAGYSYIYIDGKHYVASRLAWFYMTGNWPLKEIDHKNRNPSNDKFGNLREATRSQNLMNREVKGVHYHKKKGRWIAAIAINRKRTYLGSFSSQEEAHVAYMARARELHGEFYYRGSQDGQ